MTTRIAPGVGANLLGQHSAERNQDATAYVGNLEAQVSEELLWELFVQAGPVVNVYVPKDRVTNLHQGYGFVEFRSEEDADYAIKVLNMIKLYGKPIRVNKASQDKKSLDVGANLFVGNLDPDVDEKLLHDTFTKMGQKHSKDRLLYQYVVNGDIEGIQFLSKQGASLEWKDKQGKTPLIVAAKDRGLHGVTKTLIDLGANVNAFCKGSHGGTPLHYAAKEGLDRTVALLLSHGANAFVKNHENRTPLDVARKNGRNLVVREIEGRICYFSGHIREAFGPGLSDASSLQMSSRIIWVVVVPRSLHKPPKRPELELVIYSTPQDAEPRRIVFLRKAKIKEPRFDQPSPALTILDNRTKIRYKFSPVTYTDKQQLRRLYNACKGISQVKPVSAQMGAEPCEVEPPRNSWDFTVASPTTWRSPITLSPPMTPLNNLHIHDSPRRTTRDYTGQRVDGSWSAPHPSPQRHSIPSAPPIDADRQTTTRVSTKNNAGESMSTCVVCWENPVEAACVPCGHVCTCLSCLQGIKDNDGVCPICRAHISQVMKLYGI